MRDQQKQALLDVILDVVASEGWSQKAIDLGAEILGDAGMGWRLFPNGVAEVIQFWSDNLDSQMIKSFSEMDSSDTKIRERVANLVRIRLMLMQKHKPAVANTMKYLGWPQNAIMAQKLVYNTVNEMWYAAGDKSTDFNFYSKRMLLEAVYTSTLIYWLNDNSPENESSWKFLENLIGNVMLLGQAPSKARACIKDMRWRAREIWAVFTE